MNEPAQPTKDYGAMSRKELRLDLEQCDFVTPSMCLERRRHQRAITAIQGISLRVAEHSITALVGTNGAGKSTTLAAVAGFMRADDAWYR